MAKQKVTKKQQVVAVSAVLVPPKKHKVEFYDYHEVAEYLEKLHKKDFRDYASKRKDGLLPNPNQDFWHMVIDSNRDEVMNGSYINLPDWEYYMNNTTTELWQKEIMQYFHDFLGDDYNNKMWVSW